MGCWDQPRQTTVCSAMVPTPGTRKNLACVQTTIDPSYPLTYTDGSKLGVLSHHVLMVPRWTSYTFMCWWWSQNGHPIPSCADGPKMGSLSHHVLMVPRWASYTLMCWWWSQDGHFLALPFHVNLAVLCSFWMQMASQNASLLKLVFCSILGFVVFASLYTPGMEMSPSLEMGSLQMTLS